MVDVHNLLEKVFSGMALTQAESQNFIDAVVNGEVDDSETRTMKIKYKLNRTTIKQHPRVIPYDNRAERKVDKKKQRTMKKKLKTHQILS